MNTFTQVNEGIVVFSPRASGTSKAGESAQGAGLPTGMDVCMAGIVKQPRMKKHRT